MGRIAPVLRTLHRISHSEYHSYRNIAALVDNTIEVMVVMVVDNCTDS
jgi:hypothetical protein